MLHLKNSKEIGFKKTYGSISKTEMEDNPNVPLPKKSVDEENTLELQIYSSK